MPLLVLSYPDLTHADSTWIQSIRAKHDQLYYDVVEPHFTFVFPISSLDLDTFVAHVKKQAQGLPYVPSCCGMPSSRKMRSRLTCISFSCSMKAIAR
jgi:hypothetical protein